MIKHLNGMAVDHETHDSQLVEDIVEIDQHGEPRALEGGPDLASAALLSMTEEELQAADLQFLEAAVADSLDLAVLSWVLDFEITRGEHGRDEVMVVIRDRRSVLIAELLAQHDVSG